MLRTADADDRAGRRQRTMRPVRLHVKLRHAVLAAAVLLVGAVAAAQPVAPGESDTDRAVRDVIETTRDYRQALERVLGFPVKDAEPASTPVHHRRRPTAPGTRCPPAAAR